jgi:hypothetical protein
MAEDKATFTFAVDEDAAGPANSAAAALAELRDELTKDVKALSEMKRAMADLKAGGLEESSQYKQLAKQVGLKSQAIAQSRAKYVELGGSFKKAGAATEGFAARVQRLTKMQTGEVAKSNRAMAEQLKKLSEEMGGSRVLRLLSSRIALMGAVGTATAAGIVLLVKYGVAQAEARRADHLRLEGLVKLRNYWGRASGNADEMQGALDRVAASSALGRDQLAGYQTQLYKMGLRGKQLETVLEGMAIKSVTQGEEQANMFAGWAAGLAHTGGNVDKFAARVKSQLGGIASKYMLQFDVQMKKFHENMAMLFAELDIEPLQKARQVLFDLFSRATPSGKALASIMTSWTQLFADGIVAVTPFFRDFIRGALLWVMKLTTALLEIRLAIKKAFVNIPMLHSMKTAAFFGYTAVMLLAVGFGILAGEILIASWPVVLFVAALWGVYELFSQLGALFSENYDGFDWMQFGKDVLLGIVEGLWAGYKALTEAIVAIGVGLWTGFKAVLGISSPSKLFADAARAIPQGIVVGIEANADDVHDALAGLTPTTAIMSPAAPSMTPSIGSAAPAAPDAAAAGTGGAARGSRGSGPTTVTIGTVTVNASGGDAKSMAIDFVRELEAALESAALSMGAAAHG